jgi:hypothetical protein
VIYGKKDGSMLLTSQTEKSSRLAAITADFQAGAVNAGFPGKFIEAQCLFVIKKPFDWFG